jgi:hypothetical protein
MRLWLPISLLVVGSLYAQPGGVTGTTVDQAGAPLARVHIRLITGDFNGNDAIQKIYGADSDAAGQYSFEAIPSGLYLVWAERTGFIPKADGPIMMLTLKPGQHLTDHKIVMMKQAVIAGRVTDEYGDPVQGVQVQAEAASKQPVSFMFNQRGAMTDDRGEFRILTSAGRYYVKADRREQNLEIRTDGGAGGPFETTYFPSAPGRENAGVLEVAAGQSLGGTEIRLLRAPPAAPVRGFTISGIVVGAPEKGQTMVSLRFGEKPDELNNTNATGVLPDGKFSITGQRPAYYSIAAIYSEGKTPLRSHSVEFHLDGDQTGLQLTLTPGEELTGKLEIVGDGPAGPPERHTIRLEMPEGSGQFAPSAPPAAEVAADGSFRLKSVAPVKWKAIVEPMPENGYLKEVAVDGRVAADGVLDFSQGVSGARLKITMSRAGGQISGRVLDKDGEPVVGLVMVFFGTDVKHLEQETPARTSDEKFTLKGIRPGKYRLIAVDVTQMMQTFSGDGEEESTMQRLFDAAEEIEIKEGDRLTKDVMVVTRIPEKKEEH